MMKNIAFKRNIYFFLHLAVILIVATLLYNNTGAVKHKQDIKVAQLDERAYFTNSNVDTSYDVDTNFIIKPDYVSENNNFSNCNDSSDFSNFNHSSTQDSVDSNLLVNVSRSSWRSNDNELVILSKGRKHKFKIELADTHETRRTGLMYRKSIAKDYGMLFDFKKSRKVSMWMKNTSIPLDVAFIDKKGVILHIVYYTTPYSLDPIFSVFPVVAALEVKAGTFMSLNIHIGEKIEHAMFDLSDNT